MTLNFDKYAQEGNRFVKELAQDLECPEDRDSAARMLRAVLNTLRDMLSPSENVQLIAQLPMFLKAVYVEGWTLKEPQKKPRHVKDFLAVIRKYGERSAGRNEEEVENTVRTVFYALRQYVSMGEIEDITAQLPKDIKQLISRSVMCL